MNNATNIEWVPTIVECDLQELTKLKAKISRYEELLINSLEHAINTSEQATKDLIRAMRIMPDELDEIGYDKENFPEMHKWVKRRA